MTFYKRCWDCGQISINQISLLNELTIPEMNILIQEVSNTKYEQIDNIIKSKVQKQKNKVEQKLRTLKQQSDTLFRDRMRPILTKYIQQKIQTNLKDYEKELRSLIQKNTDLQNQIHTKDVEIMILENKIAKKRYNMTYCCDYKCVVDIKHQLNK